MMIIHFRIYIVYNDYFFGVPIALGILLIDYTYFPHNATLNDQKKTAFVQI